MSPASVSRDEIVRFVRLIWRSGDVFELRGLARVQGQQQVTSGFFDDPEPFISAAAERSGRDNGVYFTLNPGVPALLARVPKNRLHRAGNGDTTSDRDVAHRRHLLVDIDPVRPAGVSSDDAEHDAAIELARRVAADLTALGWPDPIVADSGNGGHLIYAIDLARDDGGLVKRVLDKLSATYTVPDRLKLDRTVFNPARISKVYGTLTRKGQNTSYRPHRIARILAAPTELAAVTFEQLEAYALVAGAERSASRPNQTPESNRKQFDLETFIAEHLPNAAAQAWTGGEHGARKWLLKPCPFNAAHDRGEAYIVEMHSGATSAGCKHDSCTWGWDELRDLFEPERRATPARPEARRVADRRARDNASSPDPAPAARPAAHHESRRSRPEVLYENSDYAAAVQADIAAYGDRDNQPDEVHHPGHGPTPSDSTGAPRARQVWWRAPELVDEILRYAAEPWISLALGGEELVRVRAGGIVVIMGGSGSGKSSLTLGLLLEHAANVGPAIALSIELPADESAGRIVGMRCDASWEEALRGQVRREFMEEALNLPRLYIIDRDNATLTALEDAIGHARETYPKEPILAAIHYAQLLESKQRDVRQQVADVFKRIDATLRRHRVVGIAVSQMSRAAARAARDGDKLGADSADGGAESAAIERFASVTFTIGAASEEREDGSRAVELSLGKGRMSGGDRVIPMSYWGRTGRWRIAGLAATAANVREQRVTERGAKKQKAAELAMLGAASQATEPLTREQLYDVFPGAIAMRRAAVAGLIARGELVEVQKRRARSRTWLVWTPERAIAAQTPLVRDMEDDQ